MFILQMTNNRPTFSKNLLIPKNIQLIHLGTKFLQTNLKILKNLFDVKGV